MFDYISKISQNILSIQPDKDFVKKDYVDALTFGGRKKRTKTMKKRKIRRRKTVRRRRRTKRN
jgi:hypothetical protein